MIADKDAPTYFTDRHARSMLLRDYFAAKCMAGMIAATPHDAAFPPLERTAAKAYAYADAMLEAREL